MPTHSFATLWFSAATRLALLRKIRLSRDLAKSRRALLRLDDHLLRDIGLSPDDARSEAAKPFWRP